MVALDLPVSVSISGFSIHPAGKTVATGVGVSRFDIWLSKYFRNRTWSFWRRLLPLRSLPDASAESPQVRTEFIEQVGLYLIERRPSDRLG